MGGLRTELQRAKDKYAGTRQELIEVTEGTVLKDAGVRRLYTEIEKLNYAIRKAAERISGGNKLGVTSLRIHSL